MLKLSQAQEDTIVDALRIAVAQYQCDATNTPYPQIAVRLIKQAAEAQALANAIEREGLTC